MANQDAATRKFQPKTLGETTARLGAIRNASALTGSGSKPISAGPGISSRRSDSLARPLHPEDSALVARTTLILRALDLPASTEFNLPVPADSSSITTSPVEDDAFIITIVSHDTGVGMPRVMRAVRGRQRPGLRTPALVAMWVLGIATLAGCLQAAVEISPSPAPRPFVAQGALIGSGAFGEMALIPWASSEGSLNILGIGGGAGPGVKARGSAGLPVKSHSNNTNATTGSAVPTSTAVHPAPFSPWPPPNAFMYVPGHPAFDMSDPNGFYYWAFGQCTWWAQYSRRDENLTYMGNARYWAEGAAGRGYRTGTSPAAGATVVFQPGVQGAGGAGHVAHVVAVYPGGWFLVSEMNFYWNGGGWGRVDYRYAHIGTGVSFIY